MHGELEVAVKPLPPLATGSLDEEEGVYADVLLRWLSLDPCGDYRACSRLRRLERSLDDFEQLEWLLELEAHTCELPTVAPAIAQYRNAASSGREAVHTPAQRGARLAFALESYVSQLLARPQLLRKSLALKTFLHANVLNTHATIGKDYRDAVNAQLSVASGVQKERVAAGCTFEHQVPVSLSATPVPAADIPDKLVLWKFRSQGRHLVFSAHFAAQEVSNCVLQAEEDPYSVASNAKTADSSVRREVMHYRTACAFSDNVADAAFMHGHCVVPTKGIVTLQWENVDTSSVMSKPLEFQVQAVPLKTTSCSVMEVVEKLAAIDTAEWLQEHVKASELTSLQDLSGWDSDDGSEGSDGEYGFGASQDDEDGAWGSRFASDELREGATKADKERTAVLERRTQELEAKVFRLEDDLASSKKELKAALDQVQISEEIHKASLETITQLECVSAASRRPSGSPEPAVSAVANLPAPEISTSSDIDVNELDEMERLQKLCASFQEQCLWRSIETSQSDKRGLKLEAQLFAAQDEATSWQEKHSTVAARLEVAEAENRKLRAHKAVLVQEVKKLQPYSQVNLAALVQEAQEARMVQRSLQARLDAHERQKKQHDAMTTTNSEADVEAEAKATSAAATTAADFVIVEADGHDEP